MRGNEFLNKMELIDPAYIEAADAAPKERKKVWTGWRAAVAACVCLIVLAGTAAAVSGGGTWIVKLINSAGDYGTGYELNANIGEFPSFALSENLQAVREEIVRQFEQFEAGGYFRDWEPGHWVEQDFSADEAWAFIGLESMQKTAWDLEEWNTMLNIYGNSTGEIESILLFTLYQEGDIRLQVDTEIYTENYTGELWKCISIMGDDVSITETFRTTPNDNCCHIISTSATAMGRLLMEGYVVENGILYHLYISYPEQDAARAEELLHQWADMF